MKTLALSSVLSVALLAPAARAEETAAYRALEESLGAKALQVLDERGYVVTVGRGSDGRLLHAHWPSLRDFSRRAGDLRILLEACARLRKGVLSEGDPAPASLRLKSLAEAPAGGILTPAARAAAATAAAHLADLAALPEAARGRRGLAQTPWGRAFARRLELDPHPDLPALAERYFELLSAPESSEEASGHLIDHVRAVHGKDVSDFLKGDLIAGRLSEQTAPWLSRYLAEQRLLARLRRGPELLKELDRRGLDKDLRDLDVLLKASGPGGPISPEDGGKRKGPAAEAKDWLESLRRALEEPLAAATLRFTATELRALSAVGSDTIDAGDFVDVSLAYWIEGIAPGDKVPVSAAGFVEDETGTSSRLALRDNRSGGGPHVFVARVPVPSENPLRYRLVLSAPGAEAIRREVVVTPSRRLAERLEQAAAAESLIASCRLDEAGVALAALRRGLASAPGKPQFARLRKRVEERAAQVERHREALSGFLASVRGARLYASPEQCDYRTDRAERALAALAELPPGCDQASVVGPVGEETVRAAAAGTGVAAELDTLLERSRDSRSRQEAFDRSVRKARRLEAACRFEESASAYAGALALFDARPSARCGRWLQEHTAVRLKDLPRALDAARRSGAFDGILEEARGLFAAGDYAAALRLVQPLAQGLKTLRPGRCHDKQAAAARELAKAAGVSLGPPPAGLGDDSFAQEAAAVRAGFERLSKRRQAEAADVQAPVAPGKAPRGRSR